MNDLGTNGPRQKPSTGRNRDSVRNQASRKRERGYTAGRERATGLMGVRQPGLEDITTALKRAKEPKGPPSSAYAPLPSTTSASSAGAQASAAAAQGIANITQSLGLLSLVKGTSKGASKSAGFGNKDWQSVVPDRYEKWVQQAARKYDLSPALMAAVGQQESGWSSDVNITSSAGAVGPMQTMPFWQGAQPHNINTYRGNIFAGANILRRYFDTVPGGRRQALAAYNAGPANRSAGMDYAQSVLAILKNMRKR